MIDIPIFLQLPIGLGIGVVSVLAPTALKPFVIAAAGLLIFQSAMLYLNGGQEALTAGLGWLIETIKAFALVLVGIGIGRLGSQIVAGG